MKDILESLGILSFCLAAAWLGWEFSSSVYPSEPIVPASMEALCTTDTDCMRLCREDDPACDGGPQVRSY